MTRPLLLVALVAALLVAGTAQASVGAQAAKTCSAPDYPGSGYFTSLSVKKVGCTTGRKLALAYYRCRTAKGRAGRCTKKVMHYSCTERRESISTEIDGRVTCHRGSKKITHSYQQNL